MPQEKDADVIPLSRWRAALARAHQSGAARVEALLEQPDVARLVPALPVQELYQLIQEVGLAEAGGVLALVASEQVRGLVDFDAWQKDRVDLSRLDPWIDALVDLGPSRLVTHLRALDPELVALYLKRQVHVYDLTLEQPVDEPEGHFYPTPDRFFLLDILPEGEAGKRVERLIDWIYRGDLHYGRQVLMASRWEVDSDLEEWSYRWRSGRMADLGFAEHFTALEVYRWLDPATVRLDERSAEAAAENEEHATLPAPLADGLNRGFLGRALAAISDGDTLERVQAALVTLVNQVMAADGIEPSDLKAGPASLDRVVGYLGLGVESLARGEATLGAAALSSVALSRLFRLGFSLTLQLQRAAQTLVRLGGVTLVPGRASLLDPREAAIVAALRLPRPQCPGEDGAPNRPFRDLVEVARAARRLEEIGRMAQAVRAGLGVDLPRLTESMDPAQRARLTFRVVVATVAANVLCERPAALVPIPTADLARLRDLALLDGKLRPTARLAVTRAFAARFTEREFEEPAEWDRWQDEWLAHLEATLAPSVVGAPALDPSQITGLLIQTGH